VSAAGRFDLDGLRLEHADEVAALHLRSMEGYFLSALGRGFLRRFYMEFCRHPFDFGIVARSRGSRQLAAFVVGTSDRAAHFRSFYRRNALVLAGSVLAGALLRPEVRRGLMQRVAHLGVAARSFAGGRRAAGAGAGASLRPESVCPVRLLSIAVAPEFQGSGVAGLVAARFEDLLREAGFARVGLSVHADNERAIAFYRKTGWEETYRSEAGLWFEKPI
jgi:ribosomal protein S18 acetylase RimI-like enzyme